MTIEMLLITDLSILDGLPDDDDDTMPHSFDDNGDITDGNAYLLTPYDYTDAQQRELVKRGAVVIDNGVIVNYVRDDYGTYMTEGVSFDDYAQLVADGLLWTGWQSGRKAYVVMPAIAPVDPLPVLTDDEVYMLSAIDARGDIKALDLFVQFDFMFSDFAAALVVLSSYGIIGQVNGVLFVRR